MYEVYFGLLIALMVLMVLLAIAMIVIVMMQRGNEDGIGALTGSAESFFGKNKQKTMEAKLKRITVYIAIGMLVCSILFFVFYLLKSNL